MKKLLFLSILTFLPLLASADAKGRMHASNNVAPMESLYGEWWLVGWNDGGNWFEVTPNYVGHRSLSIKIPREGYVMAYSMVNEIFVGLLTLNGNEMIFGGERRGLSTEVDCVIMENLFFEDHICDVKYYQLEGKLLKLYYTDNDYFVFTSYLDNREEGQDDYRPFVKEGKTWNVIRSNSDGGYHFDYYMLMNEKVEKAGKNYIKMYRSEDDMTVVYDEGLLREENHKVYLFDSDMQKEFLLFDYSLKVGDTYETYSYGEQKMVSYKVLSVDDYTEGPEVIRYDYIEEADSTETQYRYLRKWTVCRTDDNSRQKTWIEGIGSLEGPLANLYDEPPVSFRNNLAYVEYDNGDYLPFSFHDEFGHVYGCNLPTGKADHSDWHHQLTYELEGDRLHVYGKALTNCGPNNYAYFYERSTDDPLVHKIEFVIQDVDPVATCIALHATDFYVPGFDPNMNYIVVDNQGGEHPVINKTLQLTYHPFVKEGKTWNYQEYYHNLWNDEQWTKDVSYVINGTTEIDGKTYYKMNRIIENVSEYCCALREENRKVWMYYDGGDHLLYDFGMSVGDSYNPLLSWESYCYQLTAIKPVQFHDNHLFNVLYYDIFEDPIDHDSYIASAPIVEGVGCEKGWNIMVLNAVIPSNGILQGENFLSCYEDGECIFTADDFKCLTNPNPADNMTYRPFVEEGKVWKVGIVSGNPVQVVDYYYFDGDTIINGKACKQMMCEQFVNPDYVDYDYVMRYPQLSYVGAWYEEDKKVYFYNANNKRFTLWYDFSADANDTIQILGQSYVIGSKQTGGMKGFKGVYRDVMMVWDEEQNNYNTTWLEGVGSIEGPGYNVYLGEEYHGGAFLMSCTVGDEVIYLNDEYEDGATPAEARKKRFDFTHTIKIQPKAPMKREKASGRSAEEQSLYGEYNDLQLDIHLNPLDEAYLVRIANESGQVVYEKTVNAGNVVALNIDISAYAKGRYSVTVENNHESFAGGFEAQTTGIEENVIIEKLKNVSIYNLQGQRISSLRKGLNIVNGQKIYVK